MLKSFLESIYKKYKLWKLRKIVLRSNLKKIRGSLGCPFEVDVSGVSFCRHVIYPGYSPDEFEKRPLTKKCLYPLNCVRDNEVQKMGIHQLRRLRTWEFMCSFAHAVKKYPTPNSDGFLAAAKGACNEN